MKRKSHIFGLLLTASALFCQEWEQVPVPSGPGSGDSGLISVAALGANDAWAVGTVRDDGGVSRQAIIHWDEFTWTSIPSPSFDSIGTSFSVAAIGAIPNHVWVAGDVAMTYPEYGRVAVMHRIADGWDHVQSIRLRPQTVYPYAARGGATEDLFVLNENSVWIAGHAAGNGDGLATTHALILEWNGSQWIEHSPPQFANRTLYLYAIDAIAQDDVWAVGHMSVIPQSPCRKHFCGTSSHSDQTIFGFVEKNIPARSSCTGMATHGRLRIAQSSTILR